MNSVTIKLTESQKFLANQPVCVDHGIIIQSLRWFDVIVNKQCLSPDENIVYHYFLHEYSASLGCHMSHGDHTALHTFAPITATHLDETCICQVSYPLVN